MSARSRRARSWTPLASVRTRLVLLFFAITTAAVGFVYLYVVPQLSSSLTAERLERLEQQGSEELDRLRAAADQDLSQRELSDLVRKSAADVDARVTLLGVRDGQPAFGSRSTSATAAGGGSARPPSRSRTASRPQTAG